MNHAPGLVERLKAVFVTTVTPFDASGAVDYGRVGANAEYLVDSGIAVLVPCGNTGEFTSLSLDEAKRVTAATVEAVAGHAAVIAGVGWSLPFDAPQAGEWARAMEIRARLAPFGEIRQARLSGNNVPAVKKTMRRLGLGEATVREPLLELDPATAEGVDEIVAERALARAGLGA